MENPIIVVITALGIALTRFIPGMLVIVIPISWGSAESLGVELFLGILTYAAIGAAQALASAKLIRSHQSAVAMLPSLLLCVYEVCISLAGGYAGTFPLLVEISHWSILLVSSAVVARAACRKEVP